MMESQKVRSDQPPVVWISSPAIASAISAVKKLPDVSKLRLKIGLFCRTPFPSAESMHKHQWATDIAQDLLENDAIAFVCRDSMLNFMKLCKDVFHLEVNINSLIMRNRKRKIKLCTLPIGLPFTRYEKLVQVFSIELNLPPFEVTFILRVDPIRPATVPRIIRRFQQFQDLIRMDSSIRGLVTYLQVLLSDNETYDKGLSSQIEETARKVNRRFSRTKWRPIVVVYGDRDNKDIKPFYEELEYMQNFGLGEEERVDREFLLFEMKLDQKILVFVPFPGVCYQMKDAFLNNTAETLTSQIIRDLKARDEERLEFLKDLKMFPTPFMKEYLMKCLLFAADHIVDSDLEECRLVSIEYLNQNLLTFVAGSKPITLILDFDGTLVPPSFGDEELSISPETVDALQSLVKHPRINVIIVSGRDPTDLRDLIGNEKIFYIGNHGLSMLYPDGNRWDYPINKDLSKIIDLMDDLYSAACVHGAYVVNHGATLVYHYRHVVPVYRKSLFKKAWNIAKSHDFVVSSWNRCLEFCLYKDYSKGDACKKALEYIYGDMWTKKTHVFYVGDHKNDEAVMRILGRDTAITAFRVTNGHFPKTVADIKLSSHYSVLRLLQWLEANVPDIETKYSALSYY